MKRVNLAIRGPRSKNNTHFKDFIFYKEIRGEYWDPMLISYGFSGRMKYFDKLLVGRTDREYKYEEKSSQVRIKNDSQ